MLSLTGCKATNISVVKDVESTENLLEYNKAIMFQTGSSIPENLEDTVYIIQSEKQFDNINNQFSRQDLQKILNEEFGELESDFYSNHMLIMGTNVEGSGSTSCTFDNMTINDKEIKININRIIFTPSTDDMTTWFFFASVDKNKLTNWSNTSAVIEKTTTYKDN